jgi:hypothetical protein
MAEVCAIPHKTHVKVFEKVLLLIVQIEFCLYFIKWRYIKRGIIIQKNGLFISISGLFLHEETAIPYNPIINSILSRFFTIKAI